MIPYYETPNGRLWHGDCLEWMEHAKGIDLVLTDPPYGIGYGGSMRIGQEKHGWTQYEGGWDESRPTKEIFALILKISGDQIIWGGNYFTDYLPPSIQWFVWDKGQRNFTLADCELAWSNRCLSNISK